MAIGTGLALLGSAAIGGIASSKAASSAAKGAQQSAQVQREMYMQSREDQTPWRDIGSQAIYQLGSLYGFTPGAGYGMQGGAAPQAGGAPAAGAPAGGMQPSGGYDFYTQLQNLEAQKREQETMRQNSEGGDPAAIDAQIKQLYASQQQQGQPQNALASAAGGGAAGAQGQGRFGAFFASPDYQFRQQEAQKAIERSAAARGGLLSGATGKAVADYSGQLAAGEYGNWYNRLANLAGIGQTSAAQTGQLGMAAGQGMGQAYQQAGQARASGYMGMGNTMTNALNNYQMLNAMQGGGGMAGVTPYGGGGVVQSSSLGTGYANPFGNLF